MPPQALLEEGDQDGRRDADRGEHQRSQQEDGQIVEGVGAHDVSWLTISGSAMVKHSELACSMMIAKPQKGGNSNAKPLR